MPVSTPNFNKYVKQLSYKLRDPVASQEGLADGKIFTLALKEDYLNRAFADLKMTLSSIISTIEKVFPDFYKVVSVSIDASTGGGGDPTSPSGSPAITPPTNPGRALKDVTVALSTFGLSEKIFEIKDLYVSINDNNVFKYKQAGNINAENYFGALYGNTSTYKSNDSAFKYYFSIIDGKIVFTGGEKACNQIMIFLESPLLYYTSNGDADINVPRFYEKIYLSMAAMEAMLDLGDNASLTKAVAYSKTIEGMLKLIELREQTIRKRETDRTK